MNESLSSRLNAVMSEKNISLRDISDATKINYEMVRRYATGAARPRDSKLELISKFIGVTPAWLKFGGEGGFQCVISNQKHSDDSFSVEFLDITASAGAGYLNSDVKEVIKLIEYNVEEARVLFSGISSENIKVINLKGDSMQGTFECGDAIYVDVSKREFDSDGIYVFTFGRGIYIKRLQLIKNVLRVKSDNQLYDPWDIHENELDQLYIHGKVLFSQSMLLRKHG